MNMISAHNTYYMSPRIRFAQIATIVACLVSLLASLNLYLLEDSNPLTKAAYSASPLLRYSYDGAYLTALLACVAICAIVVSLFIHTSTTRTIIQTVVAALVALAGFGGLLIRYPLTFMILLLAFAGIAVISFLLGSSVTSHQRSRRTDQAARMIGACVSASFIILINGIALIVHTLILNPVSHALFMQGLIGGTSWNSLLIALGVELLAIIIAGISVAQALRHNE